MPDRYEDLAVEQMEQVADLLDCAERLGAPVDDPEGHRYIKISDTLAKIISYRLRGVISLCPIKDQ